MKPLQEEFEENKSEPAKLDRDKDKQAFIDQAAMMAMQGMLAGIGRGVVSIACAKTAYGFAEALWKERERRRT